MTAPRVSAPVGMAAAIMTALSLLVRATLGSGAGQPAASPVWIDDQVASATLPPADPAIRVSHLSAADYYRLPVRPIYESYPIYVPGREPPGYLDDLRRRPARRVAADNAEPSTEAAWRQLGALVFDAPLGYDDEPFSTIVSFENTRDPAWYRTVGIRVVPGTGVMPYARYVVREDGQIAVGNLACAMCHTRVMDDGTVVVGAQGTFPFDRALAFGMRAAVAAIGDERQASQEIRSLDQLVFGMPWRRSASVRAMAALDLEHYIAAFEAIPPGVAARHGTSSLLPVQIPDLIGVQDRRYLDRTGLVQHRDAADLMRYAALNQGADFLTRYGDFVPAGLAREDLPPSQSTRYSDLQLRALARFVYGLRPPANPNVPSGAAARELATQGATVFERARCGRCHTPPLFTNNALTPVDGFAVPAEHRTRYRVMTERVGTDPRLSLDTRRGTGYYKVPSLLGVWYRGPFEHNGSVATLEDWFDPRRLRDDYRPTGWPGGPGDIKRAVPGHRFGLDLSDGDRRALIAYLKTL